MTYLLNVKHDQQFQHAHRGNEGTEERTNPKVKWRSVLVTYEGSNMKCCGFAMCQQETIFRNKVETLNTKVTLLDLFIK